MTRAPAKRPRKLQFFPAVVARYFRRDLLLLRAIGMLVTGRRDVAAGERPLRYGSPLVFMLSAIAVVDGLIVVALHMVLPGWIRTAALILGILGLVWLVGFIASLVVYPHVVSETRLRLRFSVFHDISISRNAIEDVQAFRDDPGSTASGACVDGKLVMSVASQTNIRLRTHGVVALKSRSSRLAGQRVSEIIFYTDDDEAARQWLQSPARP